jgi:nucleoside phosphorylase
MPNMGTISASAVTASIRSSFLGIQLALVVGICDVAPVYAVTQEEIVLGDIIISTAVIQYDFGRQYSNGF